jgi:hypothetical protein
MALDALLASLGRLVFILYAVLIVAVGTRLLLTLDDTGDVTRVYGQLNNTRSTLVHRTL